MNYEEKYKKALKVIEELYTLLRYQSSTDALLVSQTIEKAFPELHESEDERIRKTILKMITDMDGGYPFEKYGIIKKDAIAWLEKQGEQKSVEWSEEDEDARDIAIRIIQNGGDDCAGILDSDKALNWLKSLKPNHWKPSKEQMKAIKYFIDFHRPQANASIEGWSEFKHLESLYNDIEKL